ncbi:MAG: hypothetical protein LBT46_06860 [Planctomycetaceae bacterium]|nr:hypothetical protein [Planctomycetaceae bacterium]
MSPILHHTIVFYGVPVDSKYICKLYQRPSWKRKMRNRTIANEIVHNHYFHFLNP